jgi:hypothetical protein
MPDRWAVAAGNWSNTATWNGGTLPGSGDDVFADGRAVTIDQDITVLSIRTTQRSGGTAGGSFSTSGTRTVNANSYAGTTNCLTLSSGSGSRQNGNCYGSNTTNSRVGTTVSDSCVLNGDSYAGNGVSRNGASVEPGGTQNGNSYGGSSACVGTVLSGIQNGSSFGGTASNAFGTQILNSGIQYGDATGGTGGINRHGTSIQAGGIAIIGTATGTTSGSFGVQSASTIRYVALIKNESGSFAKSLTAQAETTDVNVPFVNYNAGGGGGSSLPVIGPGGLVY